MENINANPNGNDVENPPSIGVQFTSLHHIDHELGTITAIDVDSKSPALQKYIELLLKDIEEKNSKRVFKFDSETTEVRVAIGLLLDGNFTNPPLVNAKRLLRVEQESQIEMNKLNVKIQKGSLFQSVINVDSEKRMIIIGKADHNDFLDASDFDLHKGLPWNKKIFKSFLVITDYSGNIIKVLVSDTTNTITKYWWSSFFELTELRTDKYNTKQFIDLIDKKLLGSIKKTHPSDHTTLRNSVIGHLRANNNFDIDIFYDMIFKNYEPISENFPIEDIRKKVKEIPEKYEIDGQFQIDNSEINIRATNKIMLNEGMELNLIGEVNLSKITAFTDKEGEKFIQIKTDEGYDRFIK